MKRKTKLAASAGAALAAVGAGGAIAATKLSPNEASKAVVEDAAKQLGVEPQELNDALKQALENQIDAAVKVGRLTEEAGEVMKQRLESQDYPFFGGGGGPGFGGRHHPGMQLDAAASYLGITEDKLREALDADTSLADVAKDARKSVDGLVDALVSAQTKELDAAVTDGRLTKERRDEIVSRLDERIADLVHGVRPSREGWRFGRGPGDLARGA